MGRVLPMVLLVLPGCFYVNPINTRPVGEIRDVAPGQLMVGFSYDVTANQSYDPDGDPLEYRWEARVCTTPAPSSCGDVVWSATTENFTLHPEEHDRISVVLTVTDSYGAEATVERTYVVDNQSPSMFVTQYGIETLQDTYTVGRTITFTSTAADPDGDPVTVTWQLLPPSSSDPNQVSFTSGASGASLTPDVVGHWEVKVTADDGFGGVVSTTSTLEVVADAPPCLSATSPTASDTDVYPLLRSSGARRFSVWGVTDDLDPYPLPSNTEDPLLGGAGFRWFLAAPGGPLEELEGHDLADLWIDPAVYVAGDLLELRVEVLDRVTRDLPCDADDLTCSLDGGTCKQRLSWRLEVR
jgi:hypothetical protein